MCFGSCLKCQSLPRHHDIQEVTTSNQCSASDSSIIIKVLEVDKPGPHSQKRHVMGCQFHWLVPTCRQIATNKRFDLIKLQQVC